MKEAVLTWTEIFVENKTHHNITDLFPNTGYEIRVTLLLVSKYILFITIRKLVNNRYW